MKVTLMTVLRILLYVSLATMVIFYVTVEQNRLGPLILDTFVYDIE